MQNIDIGTWLLQQAPVVVVMGFVIYYLYKELRQERGRNNKFAVDVIKLTTLWSERAKELNVTEILIYLKDIKSILTKK